MGIFRRIATALLLLTLLLPAAGWFALRSSLPPGSGELELDGLQSEVSLRYDHLQRPYVRAESLADALAVEGWLHASHRLWQMELLRRAGRGRMAEMLGPDLLETDRSLWRFGVPQLASQLEDNASPELRGLVDAYVAGVNSAIEGYRLLPPEFLLLRHRPEPWTSRDVYALGALMAFQSAGNAEREVLRLALRERLSPEQFELFLGDGSERSDYPFIIEGEDGATTDTAPAAEIGAQERWLSALKQFESTDPQHSPLMPRLRFGSNGWVVAPGRSTTGNALFAFDSHDSLGLPNLFYEVHLFYGAGHQIRGWSVPGLPGVINGFNENIAWGFTNIGDTQDLFIEQRDPDNPRVFIEDGEHYPARVETVSIPVSGAATETLEILHSRNGPLISEQPDLALRWTVQDLGTLGLDGLLALNRAGNWEEFNAALDRHAAPALNATYADRQGNIGFRTMGLLPRRSAGDGLYPLPASAANRWRGTVPPADMPRMSNPQAGYLAAANARVNPPDSYPLVSADNAAPYRIQRLQDRLGRPGKWSPEDMQALQKDWFDGQAVLVLPAMLAALEDDMGTEYWRSMLADWAEDPLATADSAAALLFQYWYLETADAVFEPVLGEALYRKVLGQGYLLNHALDRLLLAGGDSSWWPQGRSAVLRRSLVAAQSRLRHALGSPANWRLDKLQSVELRHELAQAVPALTPLLNSTVMPWGGTPAAVGRANYSYRRPFEVVHGATVRVVADMGAQVEAAAVIPGGQSGHPLSPHYTDQFDAWLGGELAPVSPWPPDTPELVLRPRRAP